MPSTTNERACAAAASQPMIEARGIHKTFGRVPVLRNVSLTVGQGRGCRTNAREIQMGATIYWQAIKGKDITPGWRSSFVRALDLPREFTERDLDFLKGLGAGQPDFKKACDELTEAILTHERITVWAEY